MLKFSSRGNSVTFIALDAFEGCSDITFVNATLLGRLFEVKCESVRWLAAHSIDAKYY